MATKNNFNLSPEKTIVAVDLHGVLFTFNHKQIVSLFLKSKGKLKLLFSFFSPFLWADIFRLMRKGSVGEEYIVRLADKHHRLRPYVPLGVAIANAQKLNHPVLELLKTLKKNGCSLRMFSNIGDTLFADLEKKFPDVFPLFDSFTVAQHANGYMRKPQTNAFQDFLKKYNSDGNAVILIDDKKKNIRGAEKNGIIGILFASAGQLEQNLKKLGLLLD